MKDNHGLTRRHLLLTGALVVGGVAVQLPKSLAKLLRPFNISEGIAKAQDSVKDLKPFPLKKLKELDAVMDKRYKRDFWEEKEGYFVSAKTDAENNDFGIFLKAIAGSYASTLEKKLTIQFPKDKSKPNGEQAYVRTDLQKLHDFYVTTCKKAGCDAKDKIWLKIIFNVHENGVNLLATFVDEKPRSNDTSDLKSGYPLLGLSYMKKTNGVSVSEFYFKIENGDS